ncbi:MAG: GNAT family N-acetyltransferase [Paracoccus sp. (in: a-proteobacteria)]|nr:GNAT family N-acetyltransferase [Paracoccus sp. (in: a-proteobacteria)]
MTPDDLARLHSACFSIPRPWTADEFAALISDPRNFLLCADQGFLLGRAVLDEAELLTLAVAPAARRRGIGADLLARFRTIAAGRGAGTAFLEVASDNTAARALYQRGGWVQAGRRAGYYGPGIDALILRLAPV